MIWVLFVVGMLGSWYLGARYGARAQAEYIVGLMDSMRREALQKENANANANTNPDHRA